LELLYIATDLLSSFYKILSYVETELGTDTDNDLNKELEGYENIVVAEPIAVVSQDLADRLENVPRGFGASDCILFSVPGLGITVWG